MIYNDWFQMAFCLRLFHSIMYFSDNTKVKRVAESDSSPVRNGIDKQPTSSRQNTARKIEQIFSVNQIIIF
jgi:hypothetical protein